MIGKHTWRTSLFLSMGTAACLFLASQPASLGDRDAVAGTKFEKVSSFRILAGGLGNPTDVTMVNQVVPRFSMYSNPTVPLIDVLNRFDLLVTTTTNLSGLPPVDGFPAGTVARVVRPTFPNKKNPPPDNNGDGFSDNVTIYSENSASFLLGNAPTVILPGGNNILQTRPAGDDTIAGQTMLTGPNGFPEAGLCGDDVQLFPVGTGGLGVATPVVGPGPNGILETNPGNVRFFEDDIVGPTSGCPLRNICAGPNGVATSGLGGDDIQNLPCVGHFLETTDIVLNGGGIGGGAGNLVLDTPVGGDDVAVVLAALDSSGGFFFGFDADTTACQTPGGAPIAGCDDVQLIPVGTTGLADANVTVVGPGPNGVLETPPFACIIAAQDGIAGSVACTDSSGVPLPGPCDDVQLVAPGTGGLGTQDCIVGTGPNNRLETGVQFLNFITFDRKSNDGQGIQAGPNRTAESGPALADDVAIVLNPQTAPNINVPPVSAPVGIESVVTMYPAVANMGDPATKPAASGSVAFLASGTFSIGSNGDNLPQGDTKPLLAGFAIEGPTKLGVISGQEGATDGSEGLLTGLSGFVYGGFAWTDISFKRQGPNILPPDLKDNAYYATRKDGGIVMISYRRGRVSDVLAPGILDAPTDLGFVAPFESLCIGLNFLGGAGIAANCGDPDPPGTDAGKLYVIESGTGRIAIVPLIISNSPSDNGLCAVTTTTPSTQPPNSDSFQGAFCDPATGLTLDGSSCSGTSPGVCVTEGVGLPNTRVVADAGNVSFITHPFLTDPVGIVMFTPFPVPHTGRITTGNDGIADTVATGDDIQLIPLGQGFPQGRAIEAPLIGNNFNLQTTPLGDDVIIGGGTSPANPQLPGAFPPNTITAGPDGIADTPICNPNPPGTCTDIQSIPVGRGEAFKPAIRAGPNGVLDTPVAGDDTTVRSPSIFIANGDGTVVWMDLNGFDPFTHTGSPRIMRPRVKNITGIGIGNYLNGEGMQILLTTTDFGGGVVSFDPTLSDNSPSLAATLVILNDLNDTVSTKLDPSQVPIPLTGPTLPTGITHVALDSWPGADGYIGTPDDVVFSDPNNLSDPTNISLTALSEPNEMSVDGSGGNIYTGAARFRVVPAGSYSVNTLNGSFDGVLLNDPTTDLFNFISGNIYIHVGLFPKRPNSILAGPDLLVQTTACQTPAGAPITPCDDVQLTLAGDMVFPGPRGMSILAGPNGVAESGLGGDDVQLSPVGTTFSSFAVTSAGAPYNKPSPFQLVIGPGPNGVLNTCPGRDDTVGVGSAGVMANCPGVVANLASCPADFRALGLGCTAPVAGCPTNGICTGPNGIADTGIALDDLQINPPRSTGLVATATVVAPGKDEFIETSPGGDDFLGGGLPLQVVIAPGPDNILQTPAAPGDIASRLTTLSIVDLDIFAFSRPITSLETPTMPYAFLAANGTGVNSGVVDISRGFTANALDAAIDAVFPASSSFFGPSFESPTGEIDFTVRDISLTAFIDNVTGLVFGRGVERNSQVPAISLLFLDASLSPASNAFVGSAIIGRQIVQTPNKTHQLDRTEKAAKKKKKKGGKKKGGKKNK